MPEGNICSLRKRTTVGINQAELYRKTTVKYRASSVIVWGCFTAVGPGPRIITESTMNSIVISGCWYVKNYANHTSSKDWLRGKTWNILGPDLEFTDMFWCNMTQTVNARNLKQFTAEREECCKASRRQMIKYIFWRISLDKLLQRGSFLPFTCNWIHLNHCNLMTVHLEEA